MTLVEKPPNVDATARGGPELLFPEARRRRRSRWLRTSCVLVAGAVVVAIVVLSHAFGGRSPMRSSSRPTSEPHFVPPTTGADGRTSMLLRLPDGRGYVLGYPRQLDLATSRITAGGQVDWVLRSCCNAYAAPYDAAAKSLFLGPPLTTYRGIGGRPVPYYSGSQAVAPFTSSAVNYLAFTFGRWAVLVPDPARAEPFATPMTPDERRTWAASFDAHTVKSGYLVFAPRHPLQIVRGPVDVVLRSAGGTIELAGAAGCAPGASTPEPIAGGVAWCSEPGRVRVSVTGDPAFVSQVGHSLTVEQTPVVR